MREIKVRVWADGKLYSPPDYFFEIEFWEHGSVKIWKDNRKDGDKTELMDVFHLDEVTLIQYTGLKDKNGVEIFEGDIVGGDYHVDDSTMGKVIGVVEYNSMAFGFVGKKSDGSRWFDTITTPGYSEVNDIEVIGNIYENPELLDSAVKDKE